MKEQTLRSPLFWTFPSDRIPKATEDDNAHLFIHNFSFKNRLITENALADQNSCKFYQRNPWTFWRYYVQWLPKIPVSFELYSVVELQHKWREAYHVNTSSEGFIYINYLHPLLFLFLTVSYLLITGEGVIVALVHNYWHSHTHTHTHTQMWTRALRRDRPVADTAAWQNKTLTRDKHPWPRRYSKQQSQKAAAADLRLRAYIKGKYENSCYCVISFTKSIT
jgi:hypothetical protein